MVMADVDGDGDNDIMMTGKGGPVKSTLYLNDGAGNFNEATAAPFENVFGGWVAFADVDGDQDLDLLVTGSTHGGTRSAKLYMNEGSGQYALVPSPFTPCWGGEFAFGDADGDGDQDVLLTGDDQFDNPLALLYLNDGTGAFVATANTFFTPVKSSTVSFFDFDDDNDLDVLLTGENNDGIRVTELYSNSGGGSFTKVADTPFTGVAGGAVAVGDSDGDGDEDILISGQSPTGFPVTELYLNNGGGSFSQLPTSLFPGSAGGVTMFSDFDVDGDPDVLMTGFGDAGVFSYVFENVGGNTYLPADTLDGAYLSSAAIGDMDGDSDEDIVIGGTSFVAPIRGTRTYLNTIRTVGTDESSASGMVTIHPNPNNGGFTLSNSGQGIAKARIFDVTGQLVKKADWSGARQHVQLDVPPGTYFVRIEANGKRWVEKFVVQ
ncbi:MAG: hypothetical protein RLY31_2612 [Bacteroidota bacterium]